MGLFGKGKKKADSQDSEEVVVKSNKKKGGRGGSRNRNDMLLSVFSETVMDQAISEMRDNPAFMIDLGGHPFHTLWLLKASDVGGLSKRMKRADEDHGAVIACMASGRIKYVLNSVMNKADYIGFIMDPETIEAMDEFSLLKGDVRYSAMYVSDEEPDKYMQMDGDVKLSFEDAQLVSSGKINITDLLHERGSSILANVPKREDTTDYEHQEEFFDGSVDISSPLVSGDKDVDAYDSDEDVDGAGFDDEDVADEVDGADDLSGIDAALGFDAGQPDDIAMSRQAGDAADIARQAAQSTFTREEVDSPDSVPDDVDDSEMQDYVEEMAAEQSDVMSSRYFTSDLGLVIDGDAFDSHFGEGMPIAYFDEDRGEGMLNEYLSQMSVSANNELAQMHGQHMYALRERYMRMLTLFADSLVDSYDISSTSNAYGQSYQQLLQKFTEDNSDDGIQRLLEPRKAELREEFERRVKAAGEAAAVNAETAYRERHTDEFRANLRNLEGEVRADVESGHVAELNRLNEIRRLAAAKEFDLGRERILEQMSRILAEYTQQEDDLYRYHLQTMNKWIDDNRKDDIAYAETLREQQRQLEEAQRVRDEYKGYIDAEHDKFEQSQARMSAELEAVKARNADFIEDLNRRHGLDIDAMQVKLDESNKRFDELQERYDALADEKEAEWAERVASAKEEARIERKRYNKLSKQNHSVNLMWVALAVVIAIAAFFIGMILGLRQSIDYSSALVVQNAQSQGAQQPQQPTGAVLFIED